ncbi:hypothetical protein BH09PSE5_BH09PSE5_04050 [soil metagenome]
MGRTLRDLIGTVAADVVRRSTKVVDGSADDDEDELVIEIDGVMFEAFTVRDDGTGMSEDTLSHVFERHWLVRDSVANPTGTGLGSYIARGLVEAHGGKIWASSELGVGATVGFTLPKPGVR